jgi:large subunit ribosomal protein L2
MTSENARISGGKPLKASRLMALKKYKPTSPGRRFMAVSSFEEITKTEPEKSLTAPIKKTAAATSTAASPPATRAAGHKRRYRIIDFKRRKDGVPAKVAAIEYDPNRSARIALLHYADGEKAYILAPARLEVGSTVESGPVRTSAPATRCRSRTSRPARWCTTSS